MAEYLENDDDIKNESFAGLTLNLAGSVTAEADLATKKKELDEYGPS